MTLQREIQTGLSHCLRRYQLAWLALSVAAPYLVHTGGRQIGKDTTWSAPPVVQCMVEDGQQWNAFSSTAPKASEFLDDCRKWTKVVGAAFAKSGRRPPQLTTNNATTLAWDNGSRVTSRASTLRSVVGMRGSVILNEIGTIPHQRALFEATYPVVRQARANGHDAQLVVISNTTRIGTWLHEFVTTTASDPASGWTHINTPWSETVRSMGWTESRIAEERAQIIASIGIGAFNQWFECQWRSASEGFYAATLLDSISYDPAILSPADLTDLPQTIGYDIGRTRHPYALQQLLIKPDSTRYALRSFARHNVEYEAQLTELERIMSLRETLRVGIDSTGRNAHAERVWQKHRSRVLQVNMDPASTHRMFDTAKNDMERRALWIDRGDLDLRIELEGIASVATNTGGEKISIPEERYSTEQGRQVRHGDRAVSLVLANHAYHDRPHAQHNATPPAKTKTKRRAQSALRKRLQRLGGRA